MSNLVTKAEIKVKNHDSVQHPLGIQDRQILGQDLIDKPEKYLKLYGSFYKNREVLEHEANTRYKNTGKNVGSKNKLVFAKSVSSDSLSSKKFPVFPIIAKRQGVKSKQQIELSKFEKLVKERKAKASKKLDEMRLENIKKKEAEIKAKQQELEEKKLDSDLSNDAKQQELEEKNIDSDLSND